MLGPADEITVTPFKSAEDGEDYDVWLISAADGRYVLKKAKGRELEIYSEFFADGAIGVPHLIKSISCDGCDYILMEYADGKDACRGDRDTLKKTLDALIDLQERFWGDCSHSDAGLTFEESIERRCDRGKYLGDPDIEKAYGEFLSAYCTLPRTLCHDDLLPFNVIVGERGAKIIDWESAGILPYPTSIARLLAHAEEREDALFYMRGEDREFAIEYYYENLIARKGISKDEYLRAIDLFLLYEYCEWIMLGNKYADADMERYSAYLNKTLRHLGK